MNLKRLRNAVLSLMGALFLTLCFYSVTISRAAAACEMDSSRVCFLVHQSNEMLDAEDLEYEFGGIGTEVSLTESHIDGKIASVYNHKVSVVSIILNFKHYVISVKIKYNLSFNYNRLNKVNIF